MTDASKTALTTSLKALLEQEVANKVAPGVICAVFTPTDIVTQVAAGVRNVETQEPMEVDTTVFYASMSKAVCSVAAMRLVEQTGFDIDSHEALVEVLPEFKIGSGHEVSKIFDGKDEEGKFKFKDARVGVTLRHLMEHTSGLGYKFFDPTLAECYGAVLDPGAGPIGQHNLSRLFESGTQWKYGVSTDWVGFFVERLSKKPLRQAYQDLVFTPLGLPPNVLDTFKSPEMLKNISKIHMKPDGENWVPLPDNAAPQYEGTPPEGCATFASGPLSGTVAGYIQFAQSIFGNIDPSKKPLLSDATWKAFWEDSIGARGVSLSKPALTSSLAYLSHSVDVFSKAENETSELGEGWSILQTAYNRENSASGRSPGTLSWAGIAGTYFFVDRAAGIGGVIAAQILPWGGKEMTNLRDAFEKVIYEHPEAWKS